MTIPSVTSVRSILLQRLAQKGHRVYYVNANFKGQYNQSSLEENLWEVTLEQEKFAAIYASDWSENLPALQKQLDRLLHENAIRDAVVIVDYPNWFRDAVSAGKVWLMHGNGITWMTLRDF